MAKLIPDRWLEYKAYGDVIEGTKILAFKVPLKEDVNNNLEPGQRFTRTILLQAFPRLKCIIDLTNTGRYYDKKEFTGAGIRYEKIMIPGRQVPPIAAVKKFFKAMDTFTSTCGEDEIVGVHCTHGVNRTGYLICRYLVQQLGWDVEDSLKAFEAARGYPIERSIYVNALKETPREKIDLSKVSLAPERPTPVIPAERAARFTSKHSHRHHSYRMGPPVFVPRRFDGPYPRQTFRGSGFCPVPPGLPSPSGPPPPFGPRSFRYGPPIRPAMPPGQGFPLPRFPPRSPCPRAIPPPLFPPPNVPPPAPPLPPLPPPPASPAASATARPDVHVLKQLQTKKKHVRNGTAMRRNPVNMGRNDTVSSKRPRKMQTEQDFTVDTYEENLLAVASHQHRRSTKRKFH